jgi:Ca-activated chloride channel homolog
LDPRRRAAIFVGGLGLLFVVAILATSGGLGKPDESHTLTVLAGSEIKDLEPIFADMQKATGVQLSLSYIGTLDGAEKIEGGDTSDVAWFSHGKYLSLLPTAGKKIVEQQKIMLSPVIIGVKRSVADRFGWTNNPNVTWKDIQAKAADGSFHFAMTNPAASNSGFTALIGVASALSGSSDAIDTGTIDKAALREFFKGQTLTAGSSGFLADTYVRQQDEVDGIINYESILMSLNQAGKLHEPLELVYPKEGIVTADYPMMLLNKAKQEAFDKVAAYLRSPDVQRRIMTETLRRPAIPGIALDPRFPTNILVELPFPSKLDTIDALITAYLDEVRKPATAIFVLDVSGSMDGDRINQLKSAMDALTGLDTSLTGQFSRFRAREQVTIITFSGSVDDTRQFTIDDTQPNSADMQAIRTYVDGLTAGGGTAIYSALQTAYEQVATQQATDPDRLYSIVLMTDGESNQGIDSGAFGGVFAALPTAAHDVHTYPVVFGDANKDDMQSIADLTGGKLFDATSDSLGAIFKQIRGYQ